MKKKLQKISLIIFEDFLMFYQIFVSPQVKRWGIITYKHGIYELSHEFPNDLRLRILAHYQMSWNYRLVPSPHAKLQFLPILAENVWKIEINLFPLCAISHEN